MPLDGAFSPLHWMIIAVVALLVLGPDQLPSLARRMGTAYKEVKRVRGHLSMELRDLVAEFDQGESPSPTTKNQPPRAVPTDTTKEDT